MITLGYTSIYVYVYRTCLRHSYLPNCFVPVICDAASSHRIYTRYEHEYIIPDTWYKIASEGEKKKNKAVTTNYTAQLAMHYCYCQIPGIKYEYQILGVALLGCWLLGGRDSLGVNSSWTACGREKTNGQTDKQTNRHGHIAPIIDRSLGDRRPHTTGPQKRVPYTRYKRYQVLTPRVILTLIVGLLLLVPVWSVLSTLLEPQSRFGDKLLEV